MVVIDVGAARVTLLKGSQADRAQS